MGTRTTANLAARVALVGVLGLTALVALQGTALAAGTATGFEVRRVQSLPSGALTAPPFSVIGAGQVASPLNYGGMGAGGVFFRPVNGTNEHSPLAFPGLQITTTFGGDSPPTITTLHLPPGQLGNPYLPACEADPPLTVQKLQGCPSDSQVGEVTINGTRGSVYNYDPAKLPQANDRTAPAAVALVVGGPVNYAAAAPILVVPRGNGDYGLDSSTDLAGFHVTSLSILQYGLVPQPGQNPPALPYIFNPTECNTAVATGDTSFEQGPPSHSTWEMTQGANRAQLDNECARFPWNGTEPSGSGTQSNAALKVTAFATVDGDDNGAVEQPDEYRFRFITPTRAGLPYQSHYERITAVLPKGVAISPAAASAADFTICTPEQFAADSVQAAACPTTSQIGDMKVLSPLLDGNRSTHFNPSALATQGCNGPADNPCQNLVAAGLDPIGGKVWAGQQVAGHPNQFRIYGEITDGGITRVKIQGVATADEQTGQVTAVFDNLPQLPVYDIEQRFFGGDHATLTNPDTCGSFTVGTELQPWAAVKDGRQVAASPAPARPTDAFTTSYDGSGAGCPASKPFAPALSLSTDPLTAGADSALTTTIDVPERSQSLVSADVALPDGLVGALGTVPMCPRDQARAGACGDESQIGTVDVVVGNGGSPAHTPGKVYFSQPGADGELARITIVVPARVGPFDLGTTIVNELGVKLRQNGSQLGIDNVGVDRLPTMLSGIPIRVREISLRIDRGNFIRNPLTCDAEQGTGTFGSDGGATATVGAPFQANGCEGLGFSPQLSSTVGSTQQPAKSGAHPPFSTVVTQPDHQGAIRKSVVTLPTGLSVNLLGLQSVCEPDQAAAGTCPDSTRVGSARADSPLLPTALAGPVFVVRNPGGTFPKLSVELHGLINLRLAASTAVDKGRLVTTLDNLPVAPVSRFQLDIDGGPKGLLTVEKNLCPKPTMDSSFESYSGQAVKVSSPVKVVGGCATQSASKARPRVTVTVRRLSRTPLVTVKARRVGKASKLRSLRVTLPRQLAVNRGRAAKGVTVRAGTRKLARSSWTLSRKGVLTVKRPKSGAASSITVTLRSGTVRAAKTLRSRVVRKRTLPRLTFAVRVVDARSKGYSYRVRVRPSR